MTNTVIDVIHKVTVSESSTSYSMTFVQIKCSSHLKAFHNIVTHYIVAIIWSVL